MRSCYMRLKRWMYSFLQMGTANRKCHWDDLNHWIRFCRSGHILSLSFQEAGQRGSADTPRQ